MYQSEPYKEGYKAGNSDYWVGPRATTACPYVIQDHLNWKEWNEGYTKGWQAGSSEEDTYWACEDE